MDQYLYNLLSIIISVFALVMTIAGLYAVYVQIKKLRDSVWSDTHSKLCDQSFELLRFLSETPNSYPYFYEKKALDDASPDRVPVLYAAEALANFMEHLVLQRDNLPEKQWEVWRRFIYTTFKTSVVVHNFILANREWYSTELLAIADECKMLYQ